MQMGPKKKKKKKYHTYFTNVFKVDKSHFVTLKT
jgi:hypothetical protein